MRACIVFDTRFGSTEKIARRIQAGLDSQGVETVCLNVRDADLESLKRADLLCLGAPTEAFTASKPMKEFMHRIEGMRFSQARGFAFDTKLESRFSGSAAKFIQSRLERLGVSMVRRYESAIVYGPSPSRLREGEEQRFQAIGVELAKAAMAVAESAGR